MRATVRCIRSWPGSIFKTPGLRDQTAGLEDSFEPGRSRTRQSGLNKLKITIMRPTNDFNSESTNDPNSEPLSKAQD